MKKKLFCCVIAFMLLVAGCAELPTASYADGTTSFVQKTEMPQNDIEKSTAISQNDLRILMDIGQAYAENDRQCELLETEITNAIRLAGGPENIAFDSIPLEGNEREITLERIRTEIMAGEGPDVFIIMTKGSNSLFPIPEKAMQEGVFLTLDEYIQNAELADWDSLTRPVLEAGRTDEGQQLVPMLYTLPVTIYSKESVPEMPPSGTTWQDMLADESGILRRAAIMHRFESGGLTVLPEDSILSMLGEFVNYETQEILFSEEDLLHSMEELMVLEKEINAESFEGLPDYFQGRLYGLPKLTSESGKVLSIDRETPVTMVPIYSRSGDVTATVQAYTGINRNTKHPEEAFFVVDYLMSTQGQQNLNLFQGSVGLPVNEAVLSEKHPQRARINHYFTDENFEALCNLRDQISKVYFENSLVWTLSSLYYTCQGIQSGEITGQTVEEIVAETYDALKQMLSE